MMTDQDRTLENATLGGGCFWCLEAVYQEVRGVESVVSGYADPPFQMMRFNGKPAIGLALANISGGNVVHTGQNLERRIAERQGRLLRVRGRLPGARPALDAEPLVEAGVVPERSGP